MSPRAARSELPPETEPIRYRGQSLRSKKAFWNGCQRTIPPDETLEKIRPTFRRIGLTRLANVTGLDRIGIPTVLSVRPNSRYLAVDAGKGFTLVAAQVSAAMECIERWHGDTVEVPRIRASYADLGGGDSVIPLELLPLCRNSLFNPNVPEDWSMGWDLVHQCEVAVPAVMVGMDRQRVPLTEMLSFPSSSNGLASGNTFLEAVTSGLLELVERDAVACQRALARSGRNGGLIALETVKYPLVRELLDRLKAAAVSLLLEDCTTDIGVPVYTACIYDEDSRHVGIYRGYGAHLDPEIAMVRAITEAVQGRLVYITGSRDDFFRHNYLRLKLVDDDATRTALNALPLTVDAGTREPLSTPSFEGDLAILIKRIRGVGLDQVIVRDLTQSGFDVSVVRVLCPGLEGYLTEYYAPGKRARTLLQREPS